MKIISYKLNANGTIPDFVKDGGYLAKNADNTTNMVLLGVSKEGADLLGIENEFATEADAFAYVSTYLSNLTTLDATTGKETNFVVADAVTELFNKVI
jgi:hypothetical protein